MDLHPFMDWMERVKSNILPVSENQRSVSEALKEWTYDGEMYDLETPHETCQLCDHPDIRFQFVITNQKNRNRLLIGSECVTKFGGIKVVDEYGNALPTPEAKRKVGRDRRKLISDAQTKSLINSLIELGRVDTEFKISSFETDYRERRSFTPKQLALLIWRFEKYKVPFNKSYFNINIRKAKDKKALLEMVDWKLRKMWPCLSTSQKTWVRENKVI